MTGLQPRIILQACREIVYFTNLPQSISEFLALHYSTRFIFTKFPFGKCIVDHTLSISYWRKDKTQKLIRNKRNKKLLNENIRKMDHYQLTSRNILRQIFYIK